jgi:hypothetical protein
LNTGAEDNIEELTRKDELSVSLENFALMTDDVIVWNYNERVLMTQSAAAGELGEYSKGSSTDLLVPSD